MIVRGVLWLLPRVDGSTSWKTPQKTKALSKSRKKFAKTERGRKEEAFVNQSRPFMIVVAVGVSSFPVLGSFFFFFVFSFSACFLWLRFTLHDFLTWVFLLLVGFSPSRSLCDCGFCFPASTLTRRNDEELREQNVPVRLEEKRTVFTPTLHLGLKSDPSSIFRFNHRGTGEGAES